MVNHLIISHLLLLLFSGSITLKAAKIDGLQHSIAYQKPNDISQYWVSEKLDGIRGRWTGKSLITRNGNHINVPPWFVKLWPNTPLDGEIWLNHGEFQATMSCISKQGVQHYSCWRQLTFMLFDLPEHPGTFTARISALKTLIQETNSPYLQLIPQVKVSTFSALENTLSTVINNQGEGLMLHHKDAYYQVGRTPTLMKLKRKQDAEAQVIAHIAGKGKYTGMLGSLQVKMPNGLTFRIGSGFSDKERQQPPAIGSTITYQYIGKTKRGVPKFASFLRIRPTE
ncbi:DNA ligase [Thalassotalea sp. 1_MG-2023]|uniref:DNA ligase n=1 Tax=Thalassotalea sp. 1_MG-2023 TaxID=3062680 RepID=UPI0026E48885|nr:DNA ligase [Thalassotalea sp. 1_MG-2023]MDO6427110.1 DNA ligase [Thalassotalea sp. 1_MG-2023]